MGPNSVCTSVEFTGCLLKLWTPSSQPPRVWLSGSWIGPGACISGESSGDSEMRSEQLWVNPSPVPPGTSGGDDIFWTRPWQGSGTIRSAAVLAQIRVFSAHLQTPG